MSPVSHKMSFLPQSLNHHPPAAAALAETPDSSQTFMSISPTQSQISNSSTSQALSPNPNYSNHGIPQPPQLVDCSEHTSGSVEISFSDRQTPLPDATVSAATETAGGSSKKVTDTRRPNGQKNSRRQFNGSHSEYQSGGRGRTFSQFQNVQFGQPIGESSRALGPAQNQPTSRTVGFNGSVAHSTKKSQSMSANHLLNFQYDPISRPQPRIPPPRRQQKIRPYNKDLFLQANYRFVVLDSENYSNESMDADKMLQWENVICVKYSTPYPVQCPICLESPLCSQITSCGHIFCFPCILRYLLMGVEDHKGDCWKKCPLCFMMISLKDLYTIFIESVKHYQPDNNIEFILLTRQKNSLIPSQKNQHNIGSVDYANIDISDNFSKFIVTSDVEASVGEAHSELKDWLAGAESGLIDDIQQLPYVCESLEQLELRRKYWTEMMALTSSIPTSGNSPRSKIKICEYSSKTKSNIFSSYRANEGIDSEVYTSSCAIPCIEENNKSKWVESEIPENLDGEEHAIEPGEPLEVCGEEKLLTSKEENILPRHSNGSTNIKERDSYSFYQAVDGQHLILHPLNMKCLLHHYGSYDLLPPRISGKILQLEAVTQTESMRRRYRFLSHFSLTTTFQLCEIEMSDVLPSDALSPFLDEIKKRENQRLRVAKKEHEEKVKAEESLMHTMPITSSFGSSSIEKSYSMDDFEALGSASLSSTPPLSSERKRFSDVARLGFAAAQDSPSLRAEESTTVPSQAEEKGGTSGSSNMVTLSFANIISSAKSPEIRGIPKMDELVGKKGKKPSRVLLSTAGGRRY